MKDIQRGPQSISTYSSTMFLQRLGHLELDIRKELNMAIDSRVNISISKCLVENQKI